MHVFYQSFVTSNKNGRKISRTQLMCNLSVHQELEERMDLKRIEMIIERLKVATKILSAAQINVIEIKGLDLERMENVKIVTII